MERNIQTTIGDLQPGDRFYVLTDKKKLVWQKVESQTKITRFQTYSHFAKKDGIKYPQAFKKSTVVVFLRHTILITKQ